ncbi:hypothetical protein [Roseibacillus persicicus]|uniref:hypothetical protein n=1 Tax=Roseibacillus persicicus TaxID=454148 RepID=UPI00280FDCE6|nr:hypothetical protein [Roseibacillus persicicus]MDQ8189515.1 hypothetical protein [Roseibacillus persicicus]
MIDKARGIFICPDCGGPSAAAGDGFASCSECQGKFELPKKVEQKVLAPSPVLPSSSSNAIQRNIALKPKGGAEQFGSVEKIPEPVVPTKDIEDVQRERGEQRKRLKKKNQPPVKVYLGWGILWLGAVALVLFVVSSLQKQFAANNKNAPTVEERLSGEEREFYKQEYPLITRTFRNFLEARSTSQMAEFALKANQLDRKMTRYFKENSRKFSASDLKGNPTFWNVAFEESPGFVEVVWDGGKSGPVEAVFVKVDDSWVVDWEHFARYSTESWTVFRQRIGGTRKGVFRVYVEKVSEGEGSDFSQWLKVRIQPPYRNRERRRREASEAILLEGTDGIVSDFVHLFADREGQSEGYSELWSRDPEELRRATVELEWVQDPVTGEERMVIQKLLSEHWRSLDVENAASGESTEE